MKEKLKKVWELYEEGIVGCESRVEVSSIDSLVSQEAMSFSKALDELITLDTTLQPDTISLQDNLCRVLEAEKKAEDFLELGVFDPYAYGHIARIIIFGQNYDKLLLERFNSSYEMQDYVASKQILGLLSQRGIQDYAPEEKVSAVERYKPPKKQPPIKNNSSEKPKPTVKEKIKQKPIPAHEPKQPAYLCLTTYLHTAEPESFPILKLANILGTKKPWLDRFYAFGQRLRDLEPTLRQRDITYLSGLYSAIQQSMAGGELKEVFDSAARKGLAVGYLFALNEYIAGSDYFVPSETTNFK